AQSRQLLKSFMVVATILGIWYVWVDVLPALEALREFELWHYEGSAAESVIGADGKARIVQIPVTLADLSFCLISFFLTVLAVKNIPGAMEVAILQRLPMHQSSRYAITTVARYIIAIFGVTLALGQIGFFWSKLQWLIAAMGVGLGFGLQEVFGNFVCGLILLFERRIRVGDVVTIGDVSGKVLRVKVLATIVRDWSHKEYIVPNKDIITGRLSNWTLTNAINRVVIMTGLAYGSDTQQARSILLRIADSHPEILKDPGPIATFEGFEDSALNIQLRCYLSDLENRLAVTTNLYESIDEEFKKAGIEIAFPQRDIHIRTNMEPSSQPGIRVQTKES
ncbi:MAG: potassium efflux system protein, partial [Planctomycetota bacterium]